MLQPPGGSNVSGLAEEVEVHLGIFFGELMDKYQMAELKILTKAVKENTKTHT